MKYRLFVDMDGTLAEFKKLSTLEQLLEQGYFLNLKKIDSVVEAIRELQKEGEIEIFTLSAVLKDSLYAEEEKNKWLDQFLPEIKTENRLFCQCGENKREFVKERVGEGENDFLLDDYTKNLMQWGEKGIKLLNGINHTEGSWQGNRIRADKTGENLAEQLKKIIQQGIGIEEESYSFSNENEKIKAYLDTVLEDEDTFTVTVERNEYNYFVENTPYLKDFKYSNEKSLREYNPFLESDEANDVVQLHFFKNNDDEYRVFFNDVNPIMFYSDVEMFIYDTRVNALKEDDNNSSKNLSTLQQTQQEEFIEKKTTVTDYEMTMKTMMEKDYKSFIQTLFSLGTGIENKNVLEKGYENFIKSSTGSFLSKEILNTLAKEKAMDSTLYIVSNQEEKEAYKKFAEKNGMQDIKVYDKKEILEKNPVNFKEIVKVVFALKAGDVFSDKEQAKIDIKDKQVVKHEPVTSSFKEDWEAEAGEHIFYVEDSMILE